MQAHPLFYIGATLLVVGSWIWGGVIIASYRSWRREHPGVPAPLSIHGMLATIIVWYLATTGLALEVVGMLIPWSLGLFDKDRSARRADLFLVVRPSARLLLAAAGLRHLVLRAAAGRRRASVQRSARADGIHSVRAAVDAGRLPPPVRRSGHHRRLEAGAHDPDLRGDVSQLRHGVHRHRLARSCRPAEGRGRDCSTGSARCRGATRSSRRWRSR